MKRWFKDFFTAKYNLGRAAPTRSLPKPTRELYEGYRRRMEYLEGKDIITIDDLKFIFSKEFITNPPHLGESEGE